MAVQQLDQVRRSAFKPVLLTHLKGLAKVPPSPHSELFGNDLPARQKELKEKADLAASLRKPPEKPSSSYRYRRPNQRTPYSRPRTATLISSYHPKLRLKFIAPSPLATCLWISPIFTTLNKDGTSRLILNLKRLNLLITHIPFKMESIRDLIRMKK